MKALVQPGRFRIKQAAPDELPAAATMKVRASREAFPSDPAELDRFADAAERTAQSWDLASRQGAYFWLVVDTDHDSELVGVAHARVSDEPDAPTPLELAMIHLLDVARGSGIADRLLEIAIGDAPAHLWVLEGNERAIAFCRRHGFVEDGARRALGGDRADRHEIRMVRGLDRD